MSTKLKCLLLDDELPALSYMKALCETIAGVEVVKVFNDPVKFLEAAGRLDFNSCVLDIQMPGLSGLEVAAKLKDKLIIFTTAHKEFAAEAFDLNAVDYLRKPIQRERFEQAVTKAIARLNLPGTSNGKQILWNTDKGKTLVSASSIAYITSSDIDKRDKLLYLQDSTRLTLKNLSFEQILENLPVENFSRLNKKEIISLSILRHFSANEVQTTFSVKNELLKCSLSDIYREDFLRKMAKV